MADRSFLSRPAIVWDEQLFASGGKTCRYWDVADLRCFPTEKDPGKGASSDLASLVYGDLLVLVSALVKEIRLKVQGIFCKAENGNEHEPTLTVGVPVIVAIPEGPYLPIAVLAVYALNIPFSISNNTQAFAVLVPVEPGEGKERISRMLDETRAALILCLPPDANRLRDILASLEPAPTQRLSPEGLYCADNPLLLDFAELAQDAISHVKEGADALETMTQCFLEDDNLQRGIEQCSRILSDKENTREALSLQTQHDSNRISHIVFTSGTTGKPKGCISSSRSLARYLVSKNKAHCISDQSIVLLASALSFDPCLSDILATFQAKATLAIASRGSLSANLPSILQSLQTTHILCTPTLFGTMNTTRQSGGILGPNDFPSLKLVALGGEPIPKQIVQAWTRHSTSLLSDASHSNTFRLCATYGVTEACVYQTMGEVTITDSETGRRPAGQDVGKALDGIGILVSLESDQENLIDAVTSMDDQLDPTTNDKAVGEVVLYGSQLDEMSSYLNNPELTKKKFSHDSESGKYFYRTGDKGYLDPRTGHVHILGRISGEEGMVKINGVRVELGEIEAALVDDLLSSNDASLKQQFNPYLPVLLDAAVIVCDRAAESVDSDGSKLVIAYCVLGYECAKEVGVDVRLQESRGILCNLNPLSLLLQIRCRENVRGRCAPSAIVFVPQIPLTATGKRNQKALPTLEECVPLNNRLGEEKLLQDYGKSGAAVAKELIACLNLQPCQRQMLTTSSTFSMLGGDSLVATRIVRALYAHHHNVNNTRYLGGKYGTIDGAFNTINLLQAETLGKYVDFLDSNGLCSGEQKADNTVDGGCLPLVHSAIAADKEANEEEEETEGQGEQEATLSESRTMSRLYDALMQATSLGLTAVASGLLDFTDPNWADHGGRLGKVSGRNARKAAFRSSPLHVACLQGNTLLVAKLLEKGAKLTSPDATGTFPLQLAASGDIMASRSNRTEEEHQRRLECVKLLLDAGAPMTMKDGNKQTLLHCAARAGNTKLITYAMRRWEKENEVRDSTRDSSLDWRDHWFRTPVHWAILNGHLDTLQSILELGCSPNPPRANVHKQSSVAVESPLELCERLYGTSSGIGLEIATLLSQKKM